MEADKSVVQKLNTKIFIYSTVQKVYNERKEFSLQEETQFSSRSIVQFPEPGEGSEGYRAGWLLVHRGIELAPGTGSCGP